MTQEKINKLHQVTGDHIYGFFKDYKWLSNFYMCQVLYQGKMYGSSEAAYQAAKSEDDDIREEFTCLTPSKSKSYGRCITMREDWDEAKDLIMYTIVLDKFTRNTDLGLKLIMTGDKYLEETNYWGDTYWGTDANHIGRNQLGIILMQVRDHIFNLKSSL